MITFHFEKPELPAWAREVARPWMKILYPPEHNPWPQSRTIGRWPLGDGVEQDYIMRGGEGAREYFWAMQDVYARAPWIHAWEGPNEPYVQSQEARVMLSIFTYDWARLMRGSGLRTAVYSLAEGNPELFDPFGEPTDKYVMELSLGLQHADYLALHEYSWPRMQESQGWRCLRYRKTCEIWRRNGVKVPPILITECGIDGSTVGRGGWLDAGISEEEYVAQLSWYAAELAKDGVECATVFTATPNPRWYSFEVTESLARKIAAMPTYAPPPVDIEPQLPQEESAVIDKPFAFLGGFFTRAQYLDYLRDLTLGAVRAVYIHHSTHKVGEWQGHASMVNLIPGYRALGWDSGPHLFIDNKGLWVFTPLGQDGTGVYGHNVQTRHLELVGDFTSALPDPATWRNAVIAAAALLLKAGLSVDALRMHRDDQATKCPGDALAAAWDLFRYDVNEAMSLPDTEMVVSPVKVRWWVEEATRQLEAEHPERALAIMQSLVDLDHGLLYRYERLQAGEQPPPAPPELPISRTGIPPARFAFFDKTPPEDYRTTHPEYGPVGGAFWVTWRDVHKGVGAFDWTPIERVLAANAAMRVTLADGQEIPKPTVLHVRGYTETDGSYDKWGYFFRDYTPQWVYAGFGEFVGDGRVGHVLHSNDKRAVLPAYEHPTWRQRLGEFIAALGARYDNDPRVVAVVIDAGMAGETQIAKTEGGVNWTGSAELAIGGERVYEQYVLETMTRYAGAFLKTPIFIMNSVGKTGVRRAARDLAVKAGIGLKVSGLTDDYKNTNYVCNPGLSFDGEFQYAAELWPTLPIWLETKSGMGSGSADSKYWTPLVALSFHPDLLTVHPEWLGWGDAERNRWICAHLGVTVDTTPSAWCVLCGPPVSYEPQCNGMLSNWSQWLEQVNDTTTRVYRKDLPLACQIQPESREAKRGRRFDFRLADGFRQARRLRLVYLDNSTEAITLEYADWRIAIPRYGTGKFITHECNLPGASRDFALVGSDIVLHMAEVS